MCTMLKRAVMTIRHTASRTPIRTLTGNSRYVSRNKLPLYGRIDASMHLTMLQFSDSRTELERTANLRDGTKTMNHLLSKSFVPDIFLMKQNLLVIC